MDRSPLSARRLEATGVVVLSAEIDQAFVATGEDHARARAVPPILGVMSEADETEPTIVFAGTSVEAGLACSLLEAEGILAFLRDQHLGTGSPGMAGACGMGYVKVVVRRIDLRRAVLVLGENGIHWWKGPLPA